QLPLKVLEMDRLRLYVTGEDAFLGLLYEFLFNHVQQVLLRNTDPGVKPGAPLITLAPERAFLSVGFERDEGLLPYRAQSFPGYRLLTEFFTFPAKFRFLDVVGKVKNSVSSRYPGND